MVVLSTVGTLITFVAWRKGNADTFPDASPRSVDSKDSPRITTQSRLIDESGPSPLVFLFNHFGHTYIAIVYFLVCDAFRVYEAGRMGISEEYIDYQVLLSATCSDTMYPKLLATRNELTSSILP